MARLAIPAIHLHYCKSSHLLKLVFSPQALGASLVIQTHWKCQCRCVFAEAVQLLLLLAAHTVDYYPVPPVFSAMLYTSVFSIRHL